MDARRDSGRMGRGGEGRVGRVGRGCSRGEDPPHSDMADCPVREYHP